MTGGIARGGVFAALHGTLALLDETDQALVSSFVINKFRGDPGLLAPGLEVITGLQLGGVDERCLGDVVERMGVGRSDPTHRPRPPSPIQKQTCWIRA